MDDARGSADADAIDVVYAERDAALQEVERLRAALADHECPTPTPQDGDLPSHTASLAATPQAEEPGASWTAPDGTIYEGAGTVGWAHNEEANAALVAAARGDAARRAAVSPQQWALRKRGHAAADAELRPLGHNSLTVVMAAHLAVDAVAPEVALLREVAHASWHMLDESGESDTDGLLYVSRVDWQRVADALDAVGWTAEMDGEEHESWITLRAALQETPRLEPTATDQR